MIGVPDADSVATVVERNRKLRDLNRRRALGAPPNDYNEALLLISILQSDVRFYATGKAIWAGVAMFAVLVLVLEWIPV